MPLAQDTESTFRKSAVGLVANNDAEELDVVVRCLPDAVGFR